MDDNFTMHPFSKWESSVIWFSWIDYLLFGLMFGFSVIIGIYFGCLKGRKSSTEEYLLASRNMGVFPVAMSLTASHISGITLLGGPAEVYFYGTQYWTSALGGLLFSVLMTVVYLPVFYELELSSSYEYLKLRFDGKIRLMALFMYIIATFLYIPIVIYIPALAFTQVSGLNMHYIAPAICALCIFYTTIGGLRGVLWNDAMQFSVTLISMTVVFIVGTKTAGGFSEIWKRSLEGERIEFFNVDLDPTERTTLWGSVIGAAIFWLSSLGVNPASVQRILAVPTIDKAKRCMLIFGSGVFAVLCITSFFGLIMYAKYRTCDPYTSKIIARPDQILPLFIMDVASSMPGLPGLFISGVFSTALSTMSTHLNSLAGTIYTDFLSFCLPGERTDATSNKIIKSIIILAGIICTGMVFLVERLGGVFEICLSFSGITSGPLLGLFTMGMLLPNATSKGALVGSIVSLITMSWIVVGNQVAILTGYLKYDFKLLNVDGCISSVVNQTTIITKSSSPNYEKSQPFWVYRISFYWYTLIGALISILVGSFVSYLSNEDNCRRMNMKLYSPIIHRFMRQDGSTSEMSNMNDEEDEVNDE